MSFINRLREHLYRQRRRIYRMPKARKWFLVIVLGMAMAAMLFFDFGRDYQAQVLGAPHATAQVLPKTFLADVVHHKALGRLIFYQNDKAFFIGKLAKFDGTAALPGLVRSLSAISFHQIFLDHQIQRMGSWSYSVTNPVPGKNAEIMTQIAGLGSSLLMFAFYGFFLSMMFRQNAMLRITDRFNTVSGDTGVRFSDVAGMDSVRDEISEVVDYLRDKTAFTRVGAKAPKGVLLYGPPGNGKTLMAKAVAGECGVPFMEQNGGNVMGKFLGESSDGIKKLFAQARRYAQEFGGCIIFMDELDAIAGSRWNNQNVTHDEKINALNTLLAEMDGFGNNTGIVVIGATNRMEVLDPAILRPGRFDRKIFVPLPGKQARMEILYVYLHRIPLDPGIDVDRLATMSPQFSGADLSHWVNEAAVQAARRQAHVVTMDDFHRARDIILAGPHNTGLIVSPDEESAIAWHEAGHAEVRHATGGFVDRVSILPRGQALGITFSVPEDALLHTREQLEKELQVLLAGRAAEDIFVHQISSGAANDLERASQMAFDAVVRLGLGDRGLFVPQTESGRHDAEASAARLIETAYTEAKRILLEASDRVQRLHDQLLAEKEVDYRKIVNATSEDSISDDYPTEISYDTDQHPI